MAYVFTDAQQVDIIRFCGYPPTGETANNFSSIHFFQQQGNFLFKIAHLSEAEGEIVVQYINQLNTLEAAILSSSDNLDTDQAAVWYHNKNEVNDRNMLFESWRKRLIAFMGVQPGLYMSNNGCRSVV